MVLQMSSSLDEAYKYCPQCHVKTRKITVVYYKPQHGVFKTDLSSREVRIRVTEITYECPVCGWSYWTTIEEVE